MSGKKLALLVVAFTLAVLIFGWFFLKVIMVNYDVDRDTSQPAQTETIDYYIHTSIKFRKENQPNTDSLLSHAVIPNQVYSCFTFC
ncbi:hypothetical protein FH966_08215 [Lentibacillus cibarius]|uniref:Uncharacterized protein n=1 Tax=Lentibacillus cibarius TaxID=2583219 RepID=A0A549YIG5_9BACI|nr:hypothetical protein [Lentibacillus cibarius]TRM11668.1 hypothetical protein FH966_08215 [Lentibacillus cibarius]